MPTFQKTIEAIQNPQQSDARRQRIIKEIESITGRRLLAYVANPKHQNAILSPEDKTGFSDLMENIDGSAIDVLVHSPGGLAEVTESIVEMLRSRFDHVRFAVPNSAKSAAALLTLSGNEILMDHRSELGPIDPQMQFSSREGSRREAAHDILDGFEHAKKQLSEEGPKATPAYVPLLTKYSIGLLQGCQRAIDLSDRLSKDWLKRFMFGGDADSDLPDIIGNFFSSRDESLSHGRPILIDRCIDLGMKIFDLRKPENAELQQKLWELWCAYELHFERATPVYKMYENSAGCLLQKQTMVVQVSAPTPPQPAEPS